MRQETEIRWHYAPRLAPGRYRAYSRSAKIYRDATFKRWVCAVQFEIEDKGVRLTWYLNLGNKDTPKAGRRGNYWRAWIAANGGPPSRRDRLSPRVFEKRWAELQVEDTTKDYRQVTVLSDDCYSVVRGIYVWETGGRA